MRTICPALALAIAAAPVAAAGEPNFSAMTADYEADVCVLGGGPSGVAAAIAAASNGADTLLVEQYGFLGGASTAAGVNVFMTYRYAGGIFRDVLHRLDQLHARRGSAFDVNLMQVALDQLVAEAGVRVLLYTRGIACTVAPGDAWQGQQRRTITGLIIHNKSGIQMVRAGVYIDCTGDGDLAAWAGAPFEIGRREDGLTQPMTLIFRMGGCTYEGGSLMEYPGMEDYWASYAWNPNPGEITLNMTRIKGFSGVSGEGLTQATIEGRQQVLEAVRALQENVPGFEDAYLLEMAPQIGVRETRRVMGATVLTGEQIIDPELMYEHRADVIARNNYPVDIHDPQGTKARIVPVKDGYEIPYRTLLPRGLDNLLVSGRCISADHVALSSLRIQPTVYALGQAAGTAAAVGVEEGIGPWEVGQSDDPTEGQPHLRRMQSLLIEQGADLGPHRARQLGLYDEWYRWRLRHRLQAYAVERDFEDVPDDHPAHEAVMGLARMGVFRGLSPERFGATERADLGTVAVVISRALALLPDVPAPESVPELPERLSGQWWSDALAEMAARGVIEAASLETLDPNAPVTPDDLRGYLRAAFEDCDELPPLPPELLSEGAVTRAGLALLVWECIPHGE